MDNIGLYFENLNLAIKQCYQTGNLGFSIKVICISKEKLSVQLIHMRRGGDVQGSIRVSRGVRGRQ